MKGVKLHMGESTKSLLALILIIGTIGAAIAWTINPPDSVTWGFRIGCPMLAILALGLFFKLHFRADLAHDYLRDQVGTYFNRDGFCFSFVATETDGIAYMDAYFQNQYDSTCLGRIALRPVRGFFMGRAKFETITYEIECASGAFGVARIAIPVPTKLQGKRQSFEAGASVDYPKGKGQRLRFHDGVFLRTNTKFGNTVGTALTIAGAASGSIVLSRPATVTVALPNDVSEDPPDNLVPEIVTLWKMGDPPLEEHT